VIWHSSRAARYQRELLNVKQFRCPSDPHPEQVLSYVVNGFSFPYFKQPGDNEDVEPGDDTGPANAQAPEVVFSRVSDLSVTVTIDVRNPDIPRIAKRTAVSPFETQPASKIYLTEANKKTPLPGDRNWGVFHDIFVFRHLPFASVDARISNDRRHPGGVTAMFFDGHADVLKFNEIDSGFPRRFDDRLRMFTAFRQDD
jgi:prepilin-type processing-associated H-X9-DG protein